MEGLCALMNFNWVCVYGLLSYQGNDSHVELMVVSVCVRKNYLLQIVSACEDKCHGKTRFNCTPRWQFREISLSIDLLVESKWLRLFSLGDENFQLFFLTLTWMNMQLTCVLKYGKNRKLFIYLKDHLFTLICWFQTLNCRRWRIC